MKSKTKTILIGSLITILVLILTIFIYYKIDTRKNNKEEAPVNNNSSLESNNTVQDNNLNNNDDISQDNNSTNTTIKDEEKDNKVILYLFHGATCPACNNALKTINEERNTTFKNAEIRTYEIWNNKDNSTLMQKVADKLNVEAKYIPYFVIGDYSKDGFNKETLLAEYKKCLNNNNYQDIIKEVLKENPDLNPKYEVR